MRKIDVMMFDYEWMT